MQRYRFPSQGSRDVVELRLARLLHNYIAKNSPCFDPVFYKKLKKLGFLTQSDKRKLTIKKIDYFIEQNGYIPSQAGSTHEEIRLGKQLSQWRAKNTLVYDKILDQKYSTFLTRSQYILNKKATQVLQFSKKNGYCPRQSSKNLKEKTLGKFVNSIRCRPIDASKKLKDQLLNLKSYSIWRTEFKTIDKSNAKI